MLHGDTFVALDSVAKILVVDDDPDTPFLYSQKFRHQISQNEYSFLFCSDSDSAANTVESNPDVDVVIADIDIPPAGGVALISDIATTNNLIPCILISTYGNISFIRSAMRAGAHDFLIKPVDFNDLTETLSKAIGVAKEKKRNAETAKRLSAITDELSVSAKLQKSILPGNHLKQNGVEIYANTTPAAEVGGDFYDFFWLDSNRLGVVMADVSGKNVSAALFMTMSRTLVKSFAMFSDSPADCFKKVNIELMKENSTTMFVTAIYGILNIRERTFEYTNAGHLPIALINPKTGNRFLACDPGMALGIDDSVEFQNNVVKFEPGDTILLYTDGVPEATNANEEEYDYERFHKFLAQNRDSSPEKLTKALMDSIRSFTRGVSQSDDITTLCLKYRIKVSSRDL